MGTLNLRKKLKKRKPEFKRQELHVKKSLKRTWRSPRGKQSKLRRHKKSRGSHPGPGYGSPRAARGLDALGYRLVRVFRIEDLDKIREPKEERVVIAASVGRKKRLDIIKAAEGKGIKVKNAK